MLQFNKSQTTNTNAIYLDSVYTASITSVIVDLTQSYDQSTSSFNGTVTSAPNAYRNWLIFTNSGSSVPSASGQYNVFIYEGAAVGVYTWDTADLLWSAADFTWEEGGSTGKGDLLYSDRAFISGSNESSFNTYLSPDQTGAYITYNG